MADDKIIEMPAHTNMTPEEALAKSAREIQWKHVLIIGTDEDDTLVRRSSGMTFEYALLLLKQTELKMLLDASRVVSEDND